MNEMTRCSADELWAARSRFEATAARWALDAAQAAGLLGVEVHPVPDVPELIAGLGPPSEARMRLTADIDSLLGRVLPADVDVAEWLRRPNDAFVGMLTPLAAMSQGAHALRAVRDVLADVAEFG